VLNPALFYDIGAETQAARVAFYDIRSELMAEGYIK
jgi:CRISPR/Cas system-associated protein endoribonuclease Cas2